MEALERLDPQRRILVVRRDSGSCLSAVIEGSVDAALILGEPKSDTLTSVRVGTSQSIVVVNKSNPLANLTTISPNDLRSVAVGWPHDIRYALPLLLDLFDKSDVEPHFTHLYTIEDNTQFISEDIGCLIATNEPYIASTYPNAVFNMSRTLSRGNEGPSQENLSRLGPFYHHPMISSDRLCHQTDARIRSLIFAG
ncbi:LysR substrate-binding domain-containing protein [Senegalimassilia anaerobia]